MPKKVQFLPSTAEVFFIGLFVCYLWSFSVPESMPGIRLFVLGGFSMLMIASAAIDFAAERDWVSLVAQLIFIAAAVLPGVLLVHGFHP